MQFNPRLRVEQFVALLAASQTLDPLAVHLLGHLLEPGLLLLGLSAVLDALDAGLEGTRSLVLGEGNNASRGATSKRDKQSKKERTKAKKAGGPRILVSPFVRLPSLPSSHAQAPSRRLGAYGSPGVWRRRSSPHWGGTASWSHANSCLEREKSVGR